MCVSIIIYKATNQFNQRAYIGFSNDMEKRRYAHYSDARNGSDTHFHRAIRKYGEDAFKWRILTECGTRKKAGDLETQLIAEHDTYHNGYNSTTGGDRTWTFTPEIRKKLSDSLKGIKKKPRTAQHRKNLSKSLKGRIPWNKGIPMSEEAKRKQSKAHKGKPSPFTNKKHTKKTKKRMSLAALGRIPHNKNKTGLFGWFTNGQEEKFAKISESPAGWRKGRI